ncbi:MAG: phosphoribosylformylglycinamidine synthase subunit PurQ [Methanomassiliicoccales archaeon]|nr:phosphoribosylformylglycinamidine synthase subunit PurQ [Methanomassiliicoccales archaeon]
MKLNDIRVCVLRIEGTNCEDETYSAFKETGTNPERVHLKQLIGACPSSMRRDLSEYDILALPGGFSAGDYVRAGAIFAARMKSALSSELIEFVLDEKPVIGICNGFQILVELGMLPAFDEVMTKEPQAALATNASGRFECIPTFLRHENRGKSVFTRTLPKGKTVMFPSAHAEGNLMLPTEKKEKLLDRLTEEDQIVFRYVDPSGEYGGYPWNPNGSVRNIAGICNPIGNVLGLMPHPERVFHRYTHPDWTRTKNDPNGAGDGRAVFQSVAEYVKRKF